MSSTYRQTTGMEIIQNDKDVDLKSSLVPIIGISASRNELNQLLEFFECVPAGVNIAIIIISTSNEDWPAEVENYFYNHKNWNYVELKQSTPLAARTVYFCSPYRTPVLEKNSLTFFCNTERTDEPPTDTLFKSLAIAKCSMAVAIDFSHSASTNNSGFTAIQCAGGLAARNNDANSNVINPDHGVSTPRSIYSLLARHLKLTEPQSPTLSTSYTLAQQAMNSTHQLLTQAFGVDFRLYNDKIVRRRLERRMTLGGHESIEDYVSTLTDKNTELGLLYADLMVEMPKFFRDAIALEHLQKSLFFLTQSSSEYDRELRVWVPACSTGEDAYTLAIVLTEFLHQHASRKLKIIATDSNADSIKTANDGTYSADSVCSVPPHLLIKYFKLLENGNYKINRPLLPSIVFSAHNILVDAPFLSVNVISCRNFLTYLNKPAQTKILNSLHSSLKVHGILMLGTGETLCEIEHDFQVVNENWPIYQKIDNSQQPPSHILDAKNQQQPTSPFSLENRNNRIYDFLLSRHIPPGILIDEKRQVIHLFGKVNRYLHPAEGRQTNDLLTLLNADARPAISALIQTTFSNNEQATLRSFSITPEHCVDISTEVITDTLSKAHFILITIQDHAAPLQAPVSPLQESGASAIDKNSEHLLHALKKELINSRTALQSILSVTEQTTKALQSSNEELAASNGTLVRTNEELHSANVELYNTNSELKEKIKTSEEMLRREKELTDITNALPVMFFTSDLMGHLTFANTNFLKYTGLSCEEVLRDDNPSLIHPDDQQRAREDWAKILDQQPIDAMHRICRHDGEYRWFRVQTSSMHDSVGNIYQWLCTLIDFHESHNAYDQLDRMVQNAPLAIITLDNTGHIKQANAQALLWTGYRQVELLGTSFEILLEPHIRPLHQENLKAFIANPNDRAMADNHTIQLLRKNGELIPVEIRLNPITITDQLHVALFITDLTLRNQAEATLKNINTSLEQAIAQRSEVMVENEKRLELATHSASLGIVDWNFPTNRVSFNHRLFNMLGIPPTQDMTIALETWQACLVEEDFKLQQHLIDEATRNLTPDIESTYRIRRYDTKELRYIHSNRTLLFDERGRRIRMIGVLRDVTREREYEQALKENTVWLEHKVNERTLELTESEARFRIMADNSPILFFLADATGKLTWLNRTWQNWTGRNLAEEAEFGWLNHIHPDNQENVTKSFTVQDKVAKTLTLEFQLKNNEGKYGWLYLQSTPTLSPDGTLKGFLVSCTDIHWQKEREQEQKRVEKRLEETAKLESLGLMAGGVAHDFNNLLTGILGNIELAQWETSGEQALLKTVLADARSATLRAADLCKQMLAYSGKGHFATDNCNLNTIIIETLRFISTSIKSTVKVKQELTENLPEIIADRVQLQQIIMNLTINAGEAISEHGTIIIRTGLTKLELEKTNNIVITDLPMNGPAVYIEVEDNGVGMTTDELSRAFEPFFTTKFVGRGLGLSAVLGIVKGHNGALTVKTAKGLGTTMRVSLPQPLETKQEKSPALQAQELQQNSKILIVDDEEIVARTLHRYLDHLRMPSEYVLSGQECLARFAAEPQRYDLVILDLTMAGIDGHETFRQLRQIAPNLNVILMSGYNESEATRKFTATELAGFLPKPISEKALSDLIKRLQN